jgi:hypothetical protein
MKHNLISTIVRYHKSMECLVELESCVTSILNQTYSPVQIVLVSQSKLDSFELNLVKFFKNITKLNFEKKENIYCFGTHRLINILEINDRDLRSKLLNIGLSISEGKYISFLDFDDILYPNAFKILIASNFCNNSAISVGKAKAVLMKKDKLGNLIEIKSKPFEIEKKTKLDLFVHNFIPIHSYILNKSIIENDLLFFDENMTRMEDYLFLLKIAAKYEFDFVNYSEFICEYRFRSDKDNTNINIFSVQTDTVKMQEWHRNQNIIDQFKDQSFASVKISELVTLVRQAKKFEILLKRLRRAPVVISAYAIKFINNLYLKLRKKF